MMNVDADPMLRLQLFGGFRLTHKDGADLTPRSRKTRCLLAWLALNDGGEAEREKIAGMLWSRSGEEQARGSLRQCCKELRKLFARYDPPALSIDHRSIRIDRQRIEIDVLQAERLVVSTKLSEQLHAAKLWRGELLAGISSRDPAFDAWLESERTRRREQLCYPLEQALNAALARNMHAQALLLGRSLVAIEPAHEPAHRMLMHIHAMQGNRVAALRQYHTLKQELEQEFGTEPEPQTYALSARIQNSGPSPIVDPQTPAIPICEKRRRARTGNKVCPTASGCPCLTWRGFVNHTQNKAIDQLVAGLDDDILTALSRNRELAVIADLQTHDWSTMHQEFGVDYALSGSVRFIEPNLVRITTTLLSCDNQRQIWAEQYDCTKTELACGRNEWIADIVAKLTFSLGSDRLRHDRDNGAVHKPAYDYWLRGGQLQ